MHAHVPTHTNAHAHFCLYVYRNLWQDLPETDYNSEIWERKWKAREQRGKVCFLYIPFCTLWTLNYVCLLLFLLKKNKNKGLNTQKYTHSERVDCINSSLKHSACPTLPFRPQKDLSS